MGNKCTKPNNHSPRRRPAEIALGAPSPAKPKSSSISDVSPDISSYQSASRSSVEQTEVEEDCHSATDCDSISSRNLSALGDSGEMDQFHLEEIIFEGLLHSADFAIKGTDAVTCAIEEVKKNVNGFSETIEVLSQHAKKCNQNIRMA
ncbi:hypothetical protein HAX54_023164 [Datura stramonium]|uniref:Uncharacterized protein n=1 Tax=Datura stramonium TaxID=4076 RepID=A0ABS8UY06_DATST|nr:hypothetical protein [Datura stramonium]